MLTASGLSYQYPNGGVLRFPDVHCERSDHWLILGASGSGKTTLLQLLAGLRKPGSGDVRIAGTSLQSLGRAALDQFRGQHIGMIFQQPHFLHALNVEENLVLAARLAGKPVDRQAIRTMLDRLGIGHKLRSRTHRLSQGEQQRVAIARALVNTPDIILADEPTSALDDDHTTEVITLLEEQAGIARAALVVVTHDARLKSRFSNQIVL